MHLAQVSYFVNFQRSYNFKNKTLISQKFRLLITFANSSDPDQAKQNVGPDRDPNCFDTLIVFKKVFFFLGGGGNFDFEKKSADDTFKNNTLSSADNLYKQFKELMMLKDKLKRCFPLVRKMLLRFLY